MKRCWIKGATGTLAAMAAALPPHAAVANQITAPTYTQLSGLAPANGMLTTIGYVALHDALPLMLLLAILATALYVSRSELQDMGIKLGALVIVLGFMMVAVVFFGTVGWMAGANR